jgi:hypothetical protein
MRISNFFFLSIFLFFHFGISQKDNQFIEVEKQNKTSNNQLPNRINYENVNFNYDTLIPIFAGLFLTYHNIDSINYFKYAEELKKNAIMINYSEELITIDTKKWGVIDSTGNVIIPFICDGVKEISENIGVLSVYSASGSLNTGIPRYSYVGLSYFFDKNGLLPETKKEFMIIIEYFADNHNLAYVIQNGPAFYLPDEYRFGKRY